MRNEDNTKVIIENVIINFTHEEIIAAKRTFYNLCHKELNVRKDTKNYKKVERNVEDILITWTNAEQTQFIMPRFINRCCSSTNNMTEFTDMQCKITSLIKFIEEKTEKEEQTHKLIEDMKKEIIDTNNKSKINNDNLKKFFKDYNEELNKTVLKQNSLITSVLKTCQDLSKNVLTIENEVKELQTNTNVDQNRPALPRKLNTTKIRNSINETGAHQLNPSLTKANQSPSISHHSSSHTLSQSSKIIIQTHSNSNPSCLHQSNQSVESANQSVESANQSNFKSHHLNKNKSKQSPTTIDNRTPSRVNHSLTTQPSIRNTILSQNITNQSHNRESIISNQSPVNVNQTRLDQQSALNIDDSQAATNQSPRPIMNDNPSPIRLQSVRNVDHIYTHIIPSQNPTPINSFLELRNFPSIANQSTIDDNQSNLTSSQESYANQVRKPATPPTRRTKNIPALLDLRLSSPKITPSHFNPTSTFQTPSNNDSERDISHQLRILRQQSSVSSSSNHINGEQVTTGNSFTTKSGVAILYVGRCHLTTTLEDLKIFIQLETKSTAFLAFELKTKHDWYKSYKIIIPNIEKDTLLMSPRWHRNLIVKEFIEFRRYN